MKIEADDGVDGVDLRLLLFLTRVEPKSVLSSVMHAVWRAGGLGFLVLGMDRIVQVGRFGQYHQTSMSNP